MSEAKKQHFLPQFYLRRFVDPNTPAIQAPYLWFLDIKTKQWKRRSPKNIAHLNHYYAIQTPSGSLDHSLDKHLQNVEARGGCVLRKLIDRCALDLQEQIQFALFISQLALRTPRNETRTQAFIEMTGNTFIDQMIKKYRDDPSLFSSHREKFERQRGHPFKLGLEDLDRHRPRLVTDKAGVLGHMFQPTKKLVERLLGMEWLFLFTPADAHLVVSDDPCEFGTPHSVSVEDFNGSMTKGFEFHAPLSPSLLFAAFDGGEGGRRIWSKLSTADVVELNRRMALRSHSFIISNQQGFKGDDMLEEVLLDNERREKGWARSVTFHPLVELKLRTSAERSWDQ